MSKNKTTTIIDISLAINERTIIYPNNPPVRIATIQGQSSTHSLLEFGTHTGTHIDAPRHIFKKGKGVEKIPLETFYGKCRVLDLTREKECVSLAAIKKFHIKQGERILLKTHNSERGFKKFYNDYVYLSGDAADYLAKIGICLLGIDYLSVKQRGSADQRPHTSLLKNDIVIFEGLDLSCASPGEYTFIGFPIKLGNIDGAPARAILVKPQENTKKKQ